MIRVLHVVGGLSRGGTETTIMNLYRHIDRERIQFDFVSHHSELNDYEYAIERLGGKVFHIPEFKGINLLEYVNEWNRFFEEHGEYRILHSHAWSTASIYLPIAGKHDVYRIAHSHSVSAGEGLSAACRLLLKPPIKKLADYYMACSLEAGKWLFGEKIAESDKFSVLPNAIDLDVYRYDKKLRESTRKRYGVNDKAVIGHIGTFNNNKNQAYVIELFKTIHLVRPNTVLWLIGDGEKKEVLKKAVEAYGLAKDITFWGIRGDIPELLQAMDVFVFPSKHESFGNVALEAEAVGVPTICSINVPREASISGKAQFLPLNNAEQWKEVIINAIDSERVDTDNSLRGTRLDIEVVAKWLQDFYTNVHESKGV